MIHISAKSNAELHEIGELIVYLQYNNIYFAQIGQEVLSAKPDLIEGISMVGIMEL